MFNKKSFTHLENPVKVELQRIDSSSGRAYVFDGRIYPSVTTFTGWKEREFWKKWREENKDKVSDFSTIRGTDIHTLVETHLKNENADILCSPENDMVFSLMKEKLSRIDKIRAIEARLYSDTLKLAGTADCVAEYNNKLSVIDFKTSKKQKKKEWITDYFLQITCYSIMWEELTGQKIDNGVIILAADNGTCETFEVRTDDYKQELNTRLKQFHDEYPLYKEV